MNQETRRMTVEDMAALNNERRLQLNEENRKYYEEMLVYLRMSPVEQRKVEELLLEMLDHLLIAQREGRTAQDVFGDDPESYCKEVIQTLGRQRLFHFPRFAFIFSTVLYVGFLSDALFRLTVYPLLNHFYGVPVPEGFKADWFVMAALGPLWIEGMMFFMRKSTFKGMGAKIGWFLLLPVISVGGFLLWQYIFKDAVPMLPIPAWMSLAIGAALWSIHRLVFKGVFKHVDIF
ncbi:hypothetical protein AB1399_08005 [Hydrogenibacillus schlegelii]|uniref:DUF1129 domain-containing protein n=1 Tax=Hydrogenibacillus schlegelii TaxID=1484 RepID=A0A179ITW7_HYDSH|nr:hypothetical protein [Hydrogenibacillus schlegelii]OAR05210.1 hypothetical protein SA87_05440 [Hydrogenibacillus schlegelii]